MKVLSEERILHYLQQIHTLSGDVLSRLDQTSTQPIEDDLLDRFHSLVNALNEDRSNDSFLNDVSWNWIFEAKPSYNNVQIYGRLAWINLQLLELL